MSIQFGRWNFDGRPVDLEYLGQVNALLAPYGPDAAGSYGTSRLRMLYYAFQTTKESRRETQPHVSAAGVVLTWDGRLDNRSELIGELADLPAAEPTDIEIVAAAYDRWGDCCFGKLMGDWALSVWNASERSLTLVRDPIGPRHLSYLLEESQVTWSTILDPLVLLAGKEFPLCKEYIAGWLSYFPATHLTPYVGIHSVPPSSMVRVRPGKLDVRKYWDFDPGKHIRYATDPEYEEHFRTVFRQAVSRRLRADSPVLAELSGGMDSSSIVCMADRAIAARAVEATSLDTVSYYNDCEPDWNEQPYFSKVEQRRGRAGCHIRVSSNSAFDLEPERGIFAATPGSARPSSESDRRFAEYVISRHSRVMLSGIAGDEVTGGVPTPVPELADLLAKAKFCTLIAELKQWAIAKRKPWFRLLLEGIGPFFPSSLVGLPAHRRPPLWLNPDFARRYRLALAGYEGRWKLLGPLPSFQEKLETIHALRRQICCSNLWRHPLLERRYPYLDRNFLEFLCAVPPDQLVRPNQRRSLMRRALAGIVPDEILNRRRKAFVGRGPCIALSANWNAITEMSSEMRSSKLGIIKAKAFLETLKAERVGRSTTIVPLLRAFAIERWMRNLPQRNLSSSENRNSS